MHYQIFNDFVLVVVFPKDVANDWPFLVLKKRHCDNVTQLLKSNRHSEQRKRYEHPGKIDLVFMNIVADTSRIIIF